MSLPEDELYVHIPTENQDKEQERGLGRPAKTTAVLQTAADSVIRVGNNLNELTAALDNLVKVAERVTGKSLK